MTLYSGWGGDRSVGIAFRHVEPPHQVGDPSCNLTAEILLPEIGALRRKALKVWKMDKF